MSQSIADIIYGGTPSAPQQRWLLGGLFALVVHVGVLIVALESEPTLEFWADDLATRIHKELSRLHEAPLEPATPPPPPPPQTPPPAPPAPPVAKAAPAPPSPAPPAAEPAAAAEVLAADAPADFTGTSIVTGTASVYAGGVTSSTGKSTTAVPPGTEVAAKPGPSYARAVEPTNADWACPWPKEAERADVNEESATVRVVVDVDGAPQSVRIVRDPGFGFGAGAAACAMRERYAAARDPQGNPIRAESAPIRVTFSR